MLEGDPYVLGSKWCAVALHEAGWRAESYGNGLPSSELAAAIHRRSPKLVWLSVSSRTTDAKALTESIAVVRAAAEALALAGDLLKTRINGANLPVLVEELLRLVLRGELNLDEPTALERSAREILNHA